jgi:hypothetical protein
MLGMAVTASLFGTPHVLYEYECQATDIRHCVYSHVAHTSVCRDGVDFTPNNWCRIKGVARPFSFSRLRGRCSRGRRGEHR